MLAFDIETIPQDRVMAQPYPEYERRPPEKLVTAEALIAWRAEDRKDWEETRRKEASLDPAQGRVLCMGLRLVGEDAPVEVPYAYTEAEERDVLARFWERVAEADGHIIGFNSRPFDQRFILARSMVLGLRPTVSPEILSDWQRRLSSVYHLDLRELLTGGEQFAKGKLDDWCKFLGLPGKLEGFSGAEVYPAFLRGEHARIQEYQVPDVEGVEHLWTRLGRFFVPDMAREGRGGDRERLRGAEGLGALPLPARTTMETPSPVRVQADFLQGAIARAQGIVAATRAGDRTTGGVGGAVVTP